MSHEQITHKRRIELAALLRAGVKPTKVAVLFGMHRSSILREIERAGGRKYSVREAEKKRVTRRKKANQRFLKVKGNLKEYVIRKLKKYWSPEQIAGRLRYEKGETVVCHETIYEFIYGKRIDLVKYLRCKKGKYRRRYGMKKDRKARDEGKKRRIDCRPGVVEKRERIGDWEGDTVVGGERTTAILTHVERKSGLLMADKLDQSLAVLVREATTNRFKQIQKEKKHTVTYDNGSEFSEYELLERYTGMTVYFAYPYHSWERGTNENTNGLLRQFFPKKSPFAGISQERLDTVVQLINTRPRKRLHYQTPSEVFSTCCVSV